MDLRRITRVTNRIIRGLFYHETSRRLPPDVPVLSLADVKLPDPHIMSILASKPEKTIGGNVFSYRWVVTENNRFASVWMLIFFGSVLFVGVTMPTNGLSARDAKLLRDFS